MGINSYVLLFKKIDKSSIPCHCCRNGGWARILHVLMHLPVLLWLGRTQWQILDSGLQMKVMCHVQENKRAEQDTQASLPSRSVKDVHGLTFWSLSIKDAVLLSPFPSSSALDYCSDQQRIFTLAGLVMEIWGVVLTAKPSFTWAVQWNTILGRFLITIYGNIFFWNLACSTPSSSPSLPAPPYPFRVVLWLVWESLWSMGWSSCMKPKASSFTFILTLSSGIWP